MSFPSQLLWFKKNPFETVSGPPTLPAQSLKLTIHWTAFRNIYLKCSSNVGVMWDVRYQSNIVSSKEISYSSLHLLVVISDAQLPDTLRVVHTNLAQASQFWTFWYQNLYKEGLDHEVEGGIPPPHRTTRQTVSVDENTTPYFLPTSVDRERGKIWHKKKQQQERDQSWNRAGKVCGGRVYIDGLAWLDNLDRYSGQQDRNSMSDLFNSVVDCAYH